MLYNKFSGFSGRTYVARPVLLVLLLSLHVHFFFVIYFLLSCVCKHRSTWVQVNILDFNRIVRVDLSGFVRFSVNFFTMTLETEAIVGPTIGEEGGKKRKKKQNIDGGKKVKPPTAEELNKLRETENLFLSNMFRLQIDEMLKEVKPKQSTLNNIKEWFEKFSIALVQDMDTSHYKNVYFLNYYFNLLINNLSLNSTNLLLIRYNVIEFILLSYIMQRYSNFFKPWLFHLCNILPTPKLLMTIKENNDFNIKKKCI